MRIYSDDEEENVKATQALKDWTASGLLSPEQGAGLRPEVEPELEVPRGWMRGLIFVFTFIAGGAFLSILYVARILRDPGVLSWLAMAALAYGLMEYVIRRGARKLYRHGIEEALAISVVLFVGLALQKVIRPLFMTGTYSYDYARMSALLFLCCAGLWSLVYVRMGYLYAMAAALISLALGMPFFSHTPYIQRSILVAISVLTGLCITVIKEQSTFEYRDDEYRVIRAMLALAGYLAINLRLSVWDHWRYGQINSGFSTLGFPSSFHWVTYGLIWCAPVINGVLAIRQRDRALLWAALVTGLATLATNKPYLGWTRHEWDPMILGALLIGSAVALKRWLGAGAQQNRFGFTAQRLSETDKRRLGALGVASTFWSGGPHGSGPAPKPELGGGGRSGGGGASSGF